MTTTGTPPIFSTSTIEYAPNGRMFTRTGRSRESWLNSCWLITSAQRSSPAARAISGPWSATLVDPPIAITTTNALRIEAGVTMSRGRMPAAEIRASSAASSSGNEAVRRSSSEAGDTMCSGSMPSTPMNVCIVL